MNKERLTQSSLQQSIGTHFFNQIKTQKESQSKTKSQVQIEEQLQEVEDVFDDQFELDEDEGSQSSIFGRLRKQAKNSLKTSIYMHNAIAMTLNIFTVLTAPPFKLVSRYFFILYFIVSTVSTYRYLFNYKSYSIFEFEDLYIFLKKKSTIQIQALKTKKIQEPFNYYNSIIKYFSEHFPGVRFDYKMQKRIQDSEEYLLKTQNQSKIGKTVKKCFKNIMRMLIFWQKPNAGERFVAARDDVYLKFVKAEYWQNEDTRWIYFMYLNLPIIIACYFGGFQIIFIDFLFLLLSSKVNELSKAQSNGDKLLHDTLGYIEKKTQRNVELQKQQNGKIVENYIKLKQRQSERQRSVSNNQNDSRMTQGRQSIGQQSQISQRPTNFVQSLQQVQRGSVPSHDFAAKQLR